MKNSFQFFSVGYRETLVRTYEKTKEGKIVLSSFFLSEIERVREDTKNQPVSYLILRSGSEILTALPYAELEQKIFKPSLRDIIDGVLDLRSVTGLSAYNILTPEKSGDCAGDGSIYLGEVDDRLWFVAAEDVKDTQTADRLLVNFNSAATYAGTLRMHGQSDWGIPPRDVLRLMQENKDVGAFAGTYECVDNTQRGWYWGLDLSAENKRYQVKFMNGSAGFYSSEDTVYLRPVRSIPKMD